MVRSVQLSDAARLAEIYRPYVEGSVVTLEYVAPTHEEFERRIAALLGELPYYVYELDGRVVAYAYAHKYHERYGYRFCAELSVYVDSGFRGRGIGRELYARLISKLRELGYRNLYGIVVDPNPASFRLHESFGFREVGRTHGSGFKLGQLHDVVTFELLLGGDLPGELDEPRKM